MLPDRRGISAVEVLISLTLGLALVTLGWRVLAKQRSVAERLMGDLDVISARRLTTRVMAKELRAGVAGRDWKAPRGDSLAMRVFRGWGWVCGVEGADGSRMLVSYRGERSPNPAKDSVLVLTGSGWRAADLVKRGAAEPSCPEGLPADAEAWTLDPPIQDGLIVRVFERGTYHVADGAFRYRRGLGGRQPLTPEVFANGLSGLEGSEGRILLSLVGLRETVRGTVQPVGVVFWPPRGWPRAAGTR